MNSEMIYDALTDIREEFIVEAKEHRFNKSRSVVARWSILAASLALIIGIGGFMLYRVGLSPGSGGTSGGAGAGGAGRQDGSTVFMSYAGPIFPLSVLGDSEGISASRSIDFDFNGYGTPRPFDSSLTLYHNDIRVTDSYTLTNDTENDETVRILYPFQSSFSELYRLQPVITVDGNALETGLMAGPYSGGFTGTGSGDDHLALNLMNINSWEGYVALLSDGEYLRRTLGDSRVLDQRVTVYEFSNAWANHDAAVNPTLAASFHLDYERTTMLSYGFHGADLDWESGFMRQSFSVLREGTPHSGRNYYLIAVGDDIIDLSIQGYINGGCYAGDEMDEVTADVRRFEVVLGEFIERLLDDFLAEQPDMHIDGPQSAANGIYITLMYRAVVEHLCDYGVLSENTAMRYDTGWLEDIFSETNVIERVFYLTAEIEIPAFGSVELKAEMIKNGSYDFYGAGSGNLGVTGYDMVTTLGSDLAFISMTAGITGAQWVDIVKQNFGFDLENGVTTVTLDMSLPHYFIEVRGAANNTPNTPGDNAPSPDNNGSGGDITHETPDISESYGNTNGNNSNGALAEQDGDTVHNGEPSVQTPIFTEYITQGYEIEAALGVIALVHPDLGWDEADSDGFTARFDEDGRLIIATDGFNVFREVEGMTSAEINDLITAIRKETGM